MTYLSRLIINIFIQIHKLQMKLSNRHTNLKDIWKQEQKGVYDSEKWYTDALVVIVFPNESSKRLILVILGIAQYWDGGHDSD